MSLNYLLSISLSEHPTFRLSSKYLRTSDPQSITKNYSVTYNTIGGAQSHQQSIVGDHSFMSFQNDLKHITLRDSIQHRDPSLDSSRLSDKPLSTGTASTGIDSGMGSSRQQSRTTSFSTSTSDYTTALPSKKFEFELSRVSDRSESVQSFSRISCMCMDESGDVCGDIMQDKSFQSSQEDDSVKKEGLSKPLCLDVPRKNIESISSERLLHDILHSKGK